MFDYGRDICGNPTIATAREWLVTNGIGGYASGTVAGVLTRRYHGLLMAALEPPLGRTLLLARLDETASYDGRDYPLSASRWVGGLLQPTGYIHLERFHLDGLVPVWTYACADALVEKRVWMQHGENTTYVQYRLVRASGPLALTIRAMVNYRGHHTLAHAGDLPLQVLAVPHGVQVNATEGAAPFRLLSDRAETDLCHEWFYRYFLSEEQARGLDALEDHLHAADFRVVLQETGESVTLVASTAANPVRDGDRAYEDEKRREQTLLLKARQPQAPEEIAHLFLAADQFLVARSLPDNERGMTVIAGYPWFGDWGRDTMISLPGLTLATGRPEIAAQILRTFARFVDGGLLPNLFTGSGAGQYNAVDATLWYFEAIRAYCAETGDDDLLRDLFPLLRDIVSWHRRGTRFNIRVDPSDGLLYAGQPGAQLTWMDAKVDDWVVTPRVGKPVEINALWYNALGIMADFARRLGQSASPYQKALDEARTGFARFWNEAAGLCYDVLDGPDGDDASIRPNQLLAVALPHSPLDPARRKLVVDGCARRLLTSYGLRSLAPTDPAYVGRYGGDRRQRDAAYHQGTVWAWWIGPFVAAHMRVYHDSKAARSFLWPLLRHLSDHGVGSLSEIFDGDPPYTPNGCIAQAWSVAEVLRTWEATL
jgi:predicted glycogen debranching enzyme